MIYSSQNNDCSKLDLLETQTFISGTFPEKSSGTFSNNLSKMYSKISLGSFLIHYDIIVPFFIIETAMNKQYTLLPLDGAKCFLH